MYKEDCVYYKWWEKNQDKIRACICGARSKEEGFKSIIDEIFPDCTNCKFYIKKDVINDRLKDIMKIGIN